MTDEQLASMDSGQYTLKLPAALTVAEVESIAASFVKLLPEADALSIDAGEVRLIDLAGLQLLLCIARDADRRNAIFAWTDISKEFRTAADLSGLRGSLRMDVKPAIYND